METKIWPTPTGGELQMRLLFLTLIYETDDEYEAVAAGGSSSDVQSHPSLITPCVETPIRVSDLGSNSHQLHLVFHIYIHIRRNTI